VFKRPITYIIEAEIIYREKGVFINIGKTKNNFDKDR